MTEDKYSLGDYVSVKVFGPDLSKSKYYSGKIMEIVPPRNCQSERLNITLNNGCELLEVDPVSVVKI